MSAAAAKRPLDISTASTTNTTTNTVVKDNEDSSSKKSHSVKSNKSHKNNNNLDEETKIKRTAQNRAAQRAFRERKERKMKELEEKVNHLQNIHKQSEIESEFLRGQLFTLVKELKKFRPETSNDSEVLNYLAKHEVEQKHNIVNNNNNNSPISPQFNHNNNFLTPQDNDNKVKQNIEQKKNFSFSYPFNKSAANNNNNIPSPDGSSTSSYSSPNQQDRSSSTSSGNNNGSKFVANNNFFSNDFTTTNTPANIINTATNTTDASTPSMNWLDNILYSDNMFSQQINSSITSDKSALPSIGSSTNYDSNMLSNEFNFDDQFDEQVTDFCVKMNQVCGTRQNPIPKATTSGGTAANTPQVNSTTNTPHTINSVESTTNTNITIPSSVSSNNNNAKKLSFSDLNTANTPNMPFINDALAFPTDSNVLISQQKLNSDTPESLDNIKTSQQQSNIFDTSDFFRTTSSSGMNNNDIFNQFLQAGDEDEDKSDDEKNPLDGLINEEPSIKPQENKSAEINNINDDDDDDDNAVVPSKDEDLLKCSEIWDRITSHPKYSDIDIDGLCGELMAKAKCSERGVVVNSSDVQLALSKHMA